MIIRFFYFYYFCKRWKYICRGDLFKNGYRIGGQSIKETENIVIIETQAMGKISAGYIVKQAVIQEPARLHAK